jgi:hypothetical protein
MTKIERLEAALKVATNFVAENTVGAGRSEMTLAKIRAILNPVEYEEVEVSAGWVSTYDLEDGSMVSTWHADKDAPFAAASNRIDCQEIKVKVRREKVAPVERSVTVRAEVYGEDMEKSKGDVIGIGTPNSYPFQGHPECWGKVGVLTFTWQEDPPK